MDLVLTTNVALPCETETFEINGVYATYEDFGTSVRYASFLAASIKGIWARPAPMIMTVFMESNPFRRF